VSPALELDPCTVELIDGTKVEARLAAQFDMPEHLVVYSPRLATMRAVFRQHVHALTIDGRRRELNPTRALTDEEKKSGVRRHWPDETPGHGRKPLYTTEQRDAPKHLPVWASPGKSGRLEDPKNWLLDGQRLTAMPFEKPRRMADGAAFGRHTDILLPGAVTPYTVKYQDRGGIRLLRPELRADFQAVRFGDHNQRLRPMSYSPLFHEGMTDEEHDPPLRDSPVGGCGTRLRLDQPAASANRPCRALSGCHRHDRRRAR
jgi:hypothetical protein